MTILTANNLTKTYGEKLLFRIISFGIEQGDKIGLIGKNGAGKSTLLKIIAGSDFADEGNVDFSKSIRIEYLTQQTEYEYEDTALDYVMNGIPEIYNIFHEYHHLIHSRNPDSDKLLELSHQIDELSGWDIEAKAKQILQKVGITDFDKSLHSASGGEKKRIAIAKILISNPDLLILDEPTNHLDADTFSGFRMNFPLLRLQSFSLLTTDIFLIRFLPRLSNLTSKNFSPTMAIMKTIDSKANYARYRKIC